MLHRKELLVNCLLLWTNFSVSLIYTVFTESFDGNSWKEPLEVSGPTRCSKQANLERVVQSSFEYVQERRFCNISGPLYQYLTTLIVSKFFQISNGGIPHAATCIVMSHPFSGQLQDAFSSICRKPAIRQLKTRVMFSLSLLFLHLIKPTCLSCSYSQLQDYKKTVQLWSRWSRFRSSTVHLNTKFVWVCSEWWL